MSASKLVKPAIEYKQSYLEALEEFHREGRYTFMKLDETAENFQEYVDDLNNGKRHLYKPYDDWVEPVPETSLWLVKDDMFIGSLNIRHRLNWHLERWGGHIGFAIRPSMRGKGFARKILHKGMPYACYFGIESALITINPDNKSGISVVEFCGGKLQDETQKTAQFPVRLRYWLDCC